jgi:hypothetical protein
VPTITRITGLANQNSESNTDKVWAGLLLQHPDGAQQFVSLYGRRGQPLRPSSQPASHIPAGRRGSARDLFERARRDKLAHGYSDVDWTQARYGMLAAIRNQGTFSQGLQFEYDTALRGRSPNQPVRETPPAPREPAPGATRPTEPSPPAPEQQPDAEVLSRYIRQRTIKTPEPEPTPTPETPKQPWIRKARRQF